MQTALLVMVKVQQPSIGGGVTWPFSGCLLQHLTVLYCIVLYCSVLQYCSPAHPSIGTYNSMSCVSATALKGAAPFKNQSCSDANSLLFITLTGRI